MGGEEEEEEGGFGIIFVVDCGEEYVYVVCGGVRVASRDEMVAAYGRLGLGRRMSADLAFGLLALW
uniref:Uncharacterized protein n=1 Tax=Oryza sativa subsp. japonica TaxID=39947 RepID=Q6Z6A2_ORYSJ|nr:hypothetical protein [Oryza sativa Japonica Group]